jgi:drug/metabolite transporter (DMT)-like permease
MASNLVRFGIPGIALVLAAAFVWAVDYTAFKSGLAAARRRRQTLVAVLAVAGYLGVIAALALTGLLGRFDVLPPPLLLWILSIFGVALGVGLSTLGRRLADELSFAALVGFQAFRLPLELVMHRAATDKVMPSVMSFGGYNFDIASGATALLLGLALSRGHVPRALVVAWNALGALLLAVIVTIAFLATPLVRAFGDTQINTWVTQFPYAWMAMMVASALLGHVLVARKLRRTSSTVNPSHAPASSLA